MKEMAKARLFKLQQLCFVQLFKFFVHLEITLENKLMKLVNARENKHMGEHLHTEIIRSMFGDSAHYRILYIYI